MFVMAACTAPSASYTSVACPRRLIVVRTFVSVRDSSAAILTEMTVTTMRTRTSEVPVSSRRRLRVIRLPPLAGERELVLVDRGVRDGDVQVHLFRHGGTC